MMSLFFLSRRESTTSRRRSLHPLRQRFGVIRARVVEDGLQVLREELGVIDRDLIRRARAAVHDGRRQRAGEEEGEGGGTGDGTGDGTDDAKARSNREETVDVRTRARGRCGRRTGGEARTRPSAQNRRGGRRERAQARLATARSTEEVRSGVDGESRPAQALARFLKFRPEGSGADDASINAKSPRVSAFGRLKNRDLMK